MKFRGGKPLDSFGKQTLSLEKPFVVRYFVSLGVSRRTVFSILERFESGETLERKSGSGRKPLKLPQRKQEPAGETAVQQCWCVTALLGQEVQHQQVLFLLSCTEGSWCEVLQAPEGP